MKIGLYLKLLNVIRQRAFIRVLISAHHISTLVDVLIILRQVQSLCG